MPREAHPRKPLQLAGSGTTLVPMALRKYVTGTGLIGTLTSGYALLRGANAQKFTWRTALGWLSWGVTFAVTIGTIMDIRKASRGLPVSEDSPIHGKEEKYFSLKDANKELDKRRQKERDKRSRR